MINDGYVNLEAYLEHVEERVPFAEFVSDVSRWLRKLQRGDVLKRFHDEGEDYRRSLYNDLDGNAEVAAYTAIEEHDGR